MILFCVLFGLSMDYEVFLLSRMKEVWDRTGDNTEAVARGLERSGRIVTLGGADRRRRRGLVRVRRHRADQGARASAMAIAVALDATVVRALLVPATMRLLGHWNWWMPARARPASSAGRCRAPRPRSRRPPDEAARARARPARRSLGVVAACGGPILANPPPAHPVVAARARAAPRGRRRSASRRPARATTARTTA